MISIQDRRELFVDSFLIDRMEDTRQVLHHPVPRETAITFDKPREGRFSRYGAVFQDRDLYKLYYRGGPDGLGKDSPMHICYAESSDVSKLAGQPVRLRFSMKDADLFALKFN